MHRRGFLALGTAALLPTLAGCGESFDPIEPKKRLGSAAPLAVEIEPDREYEYVESSHEVRFAWSGETRPMDEWGSTRAGEHAADVVQHELDAAGVLGEQVGVSSESVNLSTLDDWQGSERPRATEFEGSLDRGTVVSHLYHYERDGSVYQKPAVAFDRLVEVTPRSVEVTLQLPEYAHDVVLPVVCNRTWIRNE